MYVDRKFVFLPILGLFSLITSGQGIKCYKCNTEDEGCAAGSTSVPTVECHKYETKCGSSVFEVLQDDKVIKMGIQKGCATEGEFCKYVEIFANKLLQTFSNNRLKVHMRKCDLCDSNYCNSVGRISQSVFLSLIVAVLLSVNLF